MCLSVFVEGELHEDINTIQHKFGHVVLISNMFDCQKTQDKEAPSEWNAPPRDLVAFT